LNTKKIEYYLKIAEEVSKMSHCLRSNFGVVIVKNDMITGTGYNGPSRGVLHCNPCRRAEYGHGQGYDRCVAVHAEANGIIQAGGRPGCLGATLYINSHNKKYNGVIYNESMGDFPCNSCARLIINSGIEWVIQEEYGKPAIYNIPKLVEEGKLW
jgi:dCMP deaminase